MNPRQKRTAIVFALLMALAVTHINLGISFAKSEAAMETPDLVGSTISLGSLSNLEIGPNTKLSIDYDENGNMRVNLVRGCATVRTKQNVLGQVDTVQGVAGKTDPKRKGFLSVCFPLGAAAPIVTVAEAAGAAAATGGSLAGIIAAGAAAGTLPFAFRGSNPSPSTP